MNNQSFWWKEKLGSSIHEHLLSYVELLIDLASQEQRKDMAHAFMYHDGSAFSSPYAAALHLQGKSASSIRLNISKNIIDTLTAKIAKNHPAIKAATDGADWSYRLKGKRLGKFLNAKLDETEFRRIAPLIFRDACIRGTGIVKISTENGEILPERVLKDDLLIDPFESKHGKPRQMHQVYTMAREVVAEIFPEHSSSILLAPAFRENRDQWTDDSRDTTGSMIRIVESWHLRSGPEATDGRHAICIDGATLVNEEWTRPSFPFAFLHWSAPDQGFWGTGLIEELAPIQWEVNNTIKCIQESLAIGGKLKVFINRGSKIVKTQLNNEIGAIVEYTGQMPTFMAPNPVSEQVFRHLEYVYDKAYEISGLSQMSAQSKMPSGFGDSQPAMQTYYDIETERFSQQALAYRNFYLDVADQFISTAKLLYQDNNSYSGSWANETLVEKIQWGDVDLEKDQFKLKLEAVNLVPDTRAGKLSTLKELTQIGLLPQQLLGTALQSPDLERVYATINAAHNNIEHTIELLENTDKEMPEPEPFQDLHLGINLVKAAYNENQASGAPEEVQERFQEWLQNAVATLKMSEAPQAPQGPQTAPGAPPVEEGAVAAPMAAPGMPPTPPIAA